MTSEPPPIFSDISQLHLHLVLQIQNLPSEIHIDPACIGQPQLRRSTIKKFLSNLVFQFFDILRKRGLGDVQRICRLGKRAFVGQSQHIFQLFRVHQTPPFDKSSTISFIVL